MFFRSPDQNQTNMTECKAGTATKNKNINNLPRNGYGIDICNLVNNPNNKNCKNSVAYLL